MGFREGVEEVVHRLRALLLFGFDRLVDFVVVIRGFAHLGLGFLLLGLPRLLATARPLLGAPLPGIRLGATRGTGGGRLGFRGGLGLNGGNGLGRFFGLNSVLNIGPGLRGGLGRGFRIVGVVGPGDECDAGVFLGLVDVLDL